MKAKKGFRLRELGNEYILVGEGLEQINFNKMISMNESAAYLWRETEKLDSWDVNILASLLMNEYEVSKELAQKDAQVTLDTWIKAGIVE